MTLNVGFGVLDYNMRLAEGQSQGRAMAGAAFTTALWTISPALGMAEMAYSIGKDITKGLKTAYNDRLPEHSKAYQANFGHGFVDTQARATMRQRSLAAIQQSQHGRSMMGQEAYYLHRNRMR